MTISRLGSLVGTATLLILVPSLRPNAMNAQAQEGIGIKVGDTVSVGTGQGMVLAIVRGVEGHQFDVQIINGPRTFRLYPTQLRRRGPSTRYDRANGIFEVGDLITVLRDGRWIDSKVLTVAGTEYQVTLPGNMMVWAKPEQIRFVSEAPPKAVAKAGTPPRPGLVSCTGKIEGRYAASGSMPVQMTFRAGKVTLSLMGENQSGECWTGGGKVVITLIGEEGAMELDINDDGSLQSSMFGELVKKAKSAA
ncbi:MAG: hypothetical protein IPO52_15565 [Gemmatimonadetes bacterium]|nr:hypothetical protein [Gemmatimonadota bacterium]